MSDISVLLSTHRRLEYLPEQLAAIRAQTVQPREIRIWHDGPLPPPGQECGCTVVSSSANLGVWPRFLHCLEFSTEFVAVFDDDTIPGPKWLENCVQTHQDTGGALIGAAGVRFPAGDRSKLPRYGWGRAFPEAMEVDVVGHCWFFPRNWLRMYGALPRAPGITTAGEDYHLSVIAQRIGYASFVAPHPPDNKALWSSLKGCKYGDDAQALWTRKGEESKKQAAHEHYRGLGWKLMSDREEE